jgi:hypothetical protein
LKVGKTERRIPKSANIKFASVCRFRNLDVPLPAFVLQLDMLNGHGIDIGVQIWQGLVL